MIALTCIATCSITAMMKFVFQDIDVLKVEVVLDVVDVASDIPTEEIYDSSIAEIYPMSLGIFLLYLSFFCLRLINLSLSFRAHGPRRP